jgi:hypothetical protein
MNSHQQSWWISYDLAVDKIFETDLIYATGGVVLDSAGL